MNVNHHCFQGEQLNRIEGGLDNINAEMKVCRILLIIGTNYVFTYFRRQKNI